MAKFRDYFLPDADANDVVLHCRTWQRHDVGTTPGFNGDTAAALASIEVPVLVMPGATDLYFPVGDAELEARSIPRDIPADPIAVGPPGGRGREPGGRRVREQRGASVRHGRASPGGK